MGAAIATPEVWQAVRTASIKGVPDSKLVEYFGVTLGAIQSRRFDDPEWKAAKKDHLANRASQNSSQLESKKLVAQQVEAVTATSLQEIGSQNSILLARYTDQKIKTALQDDLLPDIQDWGQLKTASELLRKATGQDKEAASVTLNLFGGGDSGFEETPILDGFCESVDPSIETQEADEGDFC
jgi:hypothetical protein